MNTLLPVLYLVCCLLAAAPLYQRLTGVEKGPSARLGQILCGFAIFFGGFFTLGLLEVMGGEARLDVGHALPVIVVLTVLLLGSRRSLALAAYQRPTPGGVGLAFDGFAPKISLVSYAILLLLALTQFPRGFEVSAYQLPTAAHILQSHSIAPWDQEYPHTFPANASIFFAFWLSFLPERVVSGMNFIFVAITAWSIQRLASQLGADRRAAAIAACGFLTLPMIALAAGELNADLGGLAFLALAAVFALESNHPRRWLLCGLSMGLAFGFKSLHLVPLGFFGLCALVSGWREAAHGGRAASALKAGGELAAGALLMAGIWLLRNAVEFGNPLYPVNLPLFGSWFGWASDPAVDFTSRHHTQFEWVAEPSLWPLYPWFEWQQFGQHFKFSAGLGAFFAAAVPVSLLAAVTAVVRHGVGRSWRLLILVASALFILATWWLLDDRQPRYLLGAIVLLLPLAGWLLGAQRSKERQWYENLLGACIVLMLGIAVSKELVLFGDRIVLSGQTSRAAFYEYPAVIDELPRGSTVLNLGGRTWHYPLFGKQLQNRVISTPAARRLLDIEPGLGSIPSAMLLAEPLRQAGVEYLFSDGADIRTDGCVQLQEIYRQTVNPLNGVPLAKARTLFHLRYCAKPNGSLSL